MGSRRLKTWFEISRVRCITLDVTGVDPSDLKVNRIYHLSMLPPPSPNYHRHHLSRLPCSHYIPCPNDSLVGRPALLSLQIQISPFPHGQMKSLNLAWDSPTLSQASLEGTRRIYFWYKGLAGRRISPQRRAYIVPTIIVLTLAVYDHRVLCPR
jgi:hypothetical protein